MGPSRGKSAIVLLSGGLDSAVALAIAREMGFASRAVSFRYGQRHAVEIDAAIRVARAAGVQEHRIVDLDLRAFGGSALTDDAIQVPKSDSPDTSSGDIPVTYVPARNTIFLSYALAIAEVSCSRDIFIGVNAVDFSGYPDCREAYIRAFERVADLGTKAGDAGDHFTIHTPLINLSKAQIIQRGEALGVDFSLTLSCYDPDESARACGRCDSCRFRRRGFVEAGVPDPTPYVEGVPL